MTLEHQTLETPRPAMGGHMVRDSMITVGTRIFQFSVIFLKQALLARALGPAGRGEYRMAMLVYDLLISYGRLGANEAIVYHAGRKSGKALEEVAGNILSLALLTGLVMVALTMLLLKPLRQTVLEGVDPLPVILMVFMVPLGMVQVYFASLLQSQRRLVSYNAINAIVSLTHITAMVLALVVFDLGVRGAVLASMVSVVMPMLIAVWHATRDMKLRPKWNWVIVKDLVTYGLKTHVTFILTATIAQVDLLVMNPLLGPSAVGIYAAANDLVGRTQQMPTAVSNALFPYMVASSSNAEIDRITERAARNLLAMILIIALGASVAGYFFIIYVLGEAFRAAYIPFLILLIGVVPQGSVQILIRNFSSRGRPLLAVIPTGLALLVNLVGDLILIPRIGMVGAAIASSTGGLVMFATGLAIFSHLSKRPWWNAMLVQSEDLVSYRQIAKKLSRRLERLVPGARVYQPPIAEVPESTE